MAHKKLYRSESDKVISGVVGGIAKYADVDSTALRLLYAALLLVTGVFPFVILYLLAIAIVPKDSKTV
jgi:phage shock protein PspC (stress-responsive transcriptional regulator)